MKKLWNRDFILMLQGNAVSALGDLLYGVAIGYWVYEKTGSNSLMGIMSSISMFVTMFLMPFTGAIIDKWNRKWVIVGMDAARSILMLAVGALAFTDDLSVPLVLTAAFLAALCSVFFSPAASTLMIDIIPHSDMVRGQSIHSGINSMVSLVGKALSGMLVAFLGVPLVVVLNGVSYLFSACTELFIQVPRTARQGEKVTLCSVLNDFSKAVHTIFSNRFLGLFVPVALVLNLLSVGPMTLMLPFCLEKGFTVDMYGWLMSMETAAYLLCVTVLGFVPLTPKMRYILLVFSFPVFLLLYVGAYLASEYYLICLFIFLADLLNCAGNMVFNAALMLALPETNRGAVLGFLQATTIGGGALSAVIFGILGDFFPLYLVFTGGTLLSIIPTLYLCFHKSTQEFMLEH